MHISPLFLAGAVGRQKAASGFESTEMGPTTLCTSWTMIKETTYIQTIQNLMCIDQRIPGFLPTKRRNFPPFTSLMRYKVEWGQEIRLHCFRSSVFLRDPHLTPTAWCAHSKHSQDHRLIQIRRPLAKGGARLEASLAGASDPSFFAWLNPAAGGTFSGLCFASLWHESCCCLRLSLAVFQGQTEG